MELAALTELNAEIDDLERSKPDGKSSTKHQLQYYERLSALQKEKLSILDKEYADLREAKARKAIEIRKSDTTSDNLRNIMHDSRAIGRRSIMRLRREVGKRVSP